jgi:hypothetical protein
MVEQAGRPGPPGGKDGSEPAGTRPEARAQAPSAAIAHTDAAARTNRSSRSILRLLARRVIERAQAATAVVEPVAVPASNA